VATLDDGSSVVESEENVWSAIKQKVVGLKLVVNGKTLISLPLGMKRYLQGKTGSCNLLGGKIKIESRWIGFESPSGSIVKIKRSELNGEIQVEV
jgi:hypothetical protein